MKAKENYTGFMGMLKLIVNILSWTALVILILLALFLAYYTFDKKMSEKKGVDPFVSLYTIVSPSMTPNINVWDVIISKRVSSPNDVKVNDVITFISTSSITSGMTITHRVIEVVQTESGVAYKTKGDNNLSPDSAPAEYKNVVGKVILRIPQLGRIQDFLGTKSGWLVAIVVPALFVIISDILKILKLVGVKSKIERMNEIDRKLKEKKALQEEIRKVNIKKRLEIDKNDNEPEPIITKKMPRVVVAMKSSLE